jgi:uncharacterized glyoxalase superfamily protein PhnB
MDFLKRAFGADEVSCHKLPDGLIAHAEMRIGDSTIGIGEATGGAAPMPAALHLYVKNADAVYRRALAAGAVSIQEPADQEYGDREAGVKDPAGNHWYIATHKGEFAYEQAPARGHSAGHGSCRTQRGRERAPVAPARGFVSCPATALLLG